MSQTRWLSIITADPAAFGTGRATLRLTLEVEHIEARPVWKPMHLQPVFQQYESVGGGVAAALFRDGLCLPSGSNLSENDLSRVVEGARGSKRCR